MFFVLVYRSKAIWLLVCPAVYTYVHYTMVEKKSLAKLLQSEGVAILAYSALFGHVYLQYEGCGWQSSYCLRYDTYFINSSYKLKDEVSFAYGVSFSVVIKPAAGLGKKRAMQDIGGTSVANKNDETNMNDNSDKEESNNNGYGGWSTNSAEAHHWNISAAIIEQNYVIVCLFNFLA